MYAATRGSNVKWGGTDFKWGGRAPLVAPLATALGITRAAADLDSKKGTETSERKVFSQQSCFVLEMICCINSLSLGTAWYLVHLSAALV